MSFKFDWSPFLINDSNYDSLSEVLTKALNRGPKPDAVEGDIKLKHLHVGNAPPRLHLAEVSAITDDSFRGIFRVEYDGDASISLQTFVEVCTKAMTSVDGYRLFSKQRSNSILAGQPAKALC